MDPCLPALQPESDPPGRAGTPRRRPGTQPSRADVSVDRTGREMPHRVGTPAGSSRPPHRLSRRSLLLAGVGLAGTTAAAALARLTDSYAAPGPPLYTRCSFGAYADNATDPDLRPFNDLEALIPARLSRMLWCQGFGGPWLSE